LSDAAVRNAKGAAKPFKLSDGGGLFLLVNPEGSRYWRLAYRFGGKQKTLAFGTYPAISLADARKRRDAAKEALAKGLDPSEARKAEKRASKIAAANTFEVIAREWHSNSAAGWKPRYSAQLMSRLTADIFPALGRRPIVEIDAPELLKVFRKIEDRGANEIARRLRQTVGQIFRYAIVTGRAGHDPAADLKGALKAPPKVRHLLALPQSEIPTFLRKLDAYDGETRTRLALNFLILTMVRTTELRPARWTEFEKLEGPEPLWRIPPDRMKMGVEHLVPLSPQALAALAELRALSGRSPLVLPSPTKEGFMSNNTMLYALYRMGYHSRATVHGFRGVASTWLNEAGYPEDWIERQLAHDERDQVRAACNSAQYLAGRRKMMLEWADHLDAISGAAATAEERTSREPT
jgi:integrase